MPRDYNVDEPPEAVVREVASEQDLLRFIPEGKVAETFDYAEDIVHYDLVLVMDKFTAADVLREVGPCSVFGVPTSMTSFA